MQAAVTPLVSIDVRLTDRSWGFAAAHATDIDAHWAMRAERQPSLFNGDILMLNRWSLQGGHFTGTCIKTDYKSFLYWRDHGGPDREVADFFCAGGLHTQEGWLILGRAGPDMSNAGLIYPPCGSLEPDDRLEGRIDLEQSVIREIHEETGIAVGKSQLGPPLLIEAWPQIVIMRPIRLNRSADELVAQIGRYLSDRQVRELSEIVVVRGTDDIRPGLMPPFTAKYIRAAFAG